MASSITLVITSGSNSSSAVGPSSAPHESVEKLVNLLMSGAGGTHNLSIDATSVSGTAPAAASGTITITNASVASNDTVTIGGVVLTAKTSGATGAQFNIGVSATATGDNLVAAVAAHATLGKLLTATNASGVVTVASNQKGLVGNLVGLASSNGTGMAVSGTTLAGGAGGAQGTVSTYRLGL